MTDSDQDHRPTTDDARPIETRRVLILANPKAGGFSPATLSTIEITLARNGVFVESKLSAYEGDIRDTVASMGGGFDIVAIHGGDGSINEALAGLRGMNGASPALAIIAGGTANVLALETQASFAAPDIARDILEGQTAPLYYGVANERPFVLMASAGLDAAVVHSLSRRLKAYIGKWAYIAAALAQKRFPRTPDLQVTVDGRSILCRMAICANSSRYGGDFIVAPRTHATRQGLEVVIVEDDSLFALLRIGWRLLWNKGVAGTAAYTIAANEIEIVSASPAPAQIDGDAFGTTPLRATSVSSPVKLIQSLRRNGGDANMYDAG